MIVLSEQQIALLVKNILIKHFGILPDEFNWDMTLEKLNNDFVIIGYLIDLEQRLMHALNRNFSLHRHIEPSFNTPKDIVDLVKKLMSSE